jgi:hypothetical protein
MREMTQADVERVLTNDDAVFYLRYGLGCAIEGAFAIWLFIHADNYRPLGAWLAYFLLTTTGACLLVGFCWYFLWAYERRAAHWYLAVVASLIGTACVALDKLFALGFSWDVALSFSLLYFAAGYGAWRLVRFFVVRSFNILLLAVSQIGAAWRNEMHR